MKTTLAPTPTNTRTQSAHTPGPWSAHVANSELRTHCDHVNTVHGLHVCDVASYGASLEQRAANARLIASAPDLLAALEYFVEELPGIIRQCCPQGVPMEVANAFDQARAALAKAQGGAA